MVETDSEIKQSNQTDKLMFNVSSIDAIGIAIQNSNVCLNVVKWSLRKTRYGLIKQLLTRSKLSGKDHVPLELSGYQGTHLFICEIPDSLSDNSEFRVCMRTGSLHSKNGLLKTGFLGGQALFNILPDGNFSSFGSVVDSPDITAVYTRILAFIDQGLVKKIRPGKAGF